MDIIQLIMLLLLLSFYYGVTVHKVGSFLISRHFIVIFAIVVISWFSFRKVGNKFFSGLLKLFPDLSGVSS